VSPSLPDVEELRGLCAGTAEAAGRWLVAWRAGRTTLETSTKSSPTDVVTEADREVEGLIRERLIAGHPGAAWWGEESGRSTGSGADGDLEWVVDPIDGTVNFLYDLPGWSVSIAAVVGGQVVAGAVAVPTLTELYSASLGGGAWLQTSGASGRRLAASTCDDLSQALVATGFAYDRGLRAVQGRAVGLMLGQVRDIRRAGAASVDFCSLAAGRVDAYVERGLQPWDRAAGALIAREAGAVVDEHPDGSVVACGPALHPALTALLDAVGAWRDT
jgi:myo-inositol-1(or 4)-monophosphatase